MTQEEIDKMIEDWVKHGLSRNLKRLIPSEKQEFKGGMRPIVKDRDDEILYSARLYLFGVIPLWKVSYTKREWQRIALMQSKRNKIVECQFIDELFIRGNKECLKRKH